MGGGGQKVVESQEFIVLIDMRIKMPRAYAGNRGNDNHGDLCIWHRVYITYKRNASKLERTPTTGMTSNLSPFPLTPLKSGRLRDWFCRRFGRYCVRLCVFCGPILTAI
jgi:hypothetical protein